MKELEPKSDMKEFFFSTSQESNSMKSTKHDECKKYEGGCLCGETTYAAEGEPLNPHLCSCTMCQKSSGAPTTVWAGFSMEKFKWTGKEPGIYQSSETVQRCFCKNCGGPLAAIENGVIDITISSLNNPNLIVPNEQKYSYKESKPSWWDIKILKVEPSLSSKSKLDYIEQENISRTLRKAIKAGRLNEVVSLVERFGETIIDCQDTQGNTGIHIAIQEKQPDILKYLLEKNGNLEIKNLKGEIPKLMLESNDSLEIKNSRKNF